MSYHTTQCRPESLTVEAMVDKVQMAFATDGMKHKDVEVWMDYKQTADLAAKLNAILEDRAREMETGEKICESDLPATPTGSEA